MLLFSRSTCLISILLMQAGFWDRNQIRLAPVFFLTPALLMFSIYVIYPVIQSIWISFHEWDGVGEMHWVGFQHYLYLMEDEKFWVAIRNNILWLILFILSPALGLGLALFLNQQIHGIKVIKSLFFFPFVINMVVVGLVFSWFYNPSYGLLGEILKIFEIKPIAVLSDEDLVTYGIIVAGMWPQIAYCMILYLTGLASIKPELIEAGRIDGAKGWKMLLHVVLPQLRPATFIAIVISVVNALRSFDLVAIMTMGGPWGSSTVLAYEMYEQSLFNYRMGYGAAIATVLFLIMDVYIAWFLYRLYVNEKASS